MRFVSWMHNNECMKGLERHNLWGEWQGGVALIRIWQWLVFIFRMGHGALWNGTKWFSIPSYNQLLHHAHHFCHMFFHLYELNNTYFKS